MTPRPRSDEGRLGVWLIGARGAVATTTIVGATALRLAQTRAVGLVTETPPLSAAPLAALDSLVFGGHDIADVPLVKAAHALCRDVGPLNLQLVRALDDELAAVDAHLRPAPDLAGRAPAHFVRDVQQDLAAFREATGARRVVMVNVASTEPLPPAELAGLDLAGLARALSDAASPAHERSGRPRESSC